MIGLGERQLALAQDFGLVCVDARMVIFPVDPRNVIKRIVLCNRESEKALIENIWAPTAPPSLCAEEFG